MEIEHEHRLTAVEDMAKSNRRRIEGLENGRTIWTVLSARFKFWQKKKRISKQPLEGLKGM